MTAPVPDHASLPVAELRIAEPTVPGPHFWSGRRDEERLSNTDPEEALADYLDLNASGTETLRAAIERLAPVTLYGFTRDTVDDVKIEACADWAIDRLIDDIDEELSDPDGGSHVLNDEGEAMVRAALVDALMRARSRGLMVPWTCHESEQRTYTREDLLALFASDIQREEGGGNRG